MNVLLVAPQPFFRIRGTPINLRNLASALGRAGHRVDLLCYPFGESPDLPGTRILRSPGFPGVRDCKVGPSLAKFPLDAMMSLAVAHRLLRQRYDVVHAVEESVFFAGPLARLRGIPVVYDMDSLISDQLAYSGFVRWKPLLRLVEAMERRALRRAAAVVSVCTALTESARRLFPAARITQIEDAPLERAFVPDPAGEEALREQFSLHGRKVVTYTGNFEAYQGLPLLLDALPTLLVQEPTAVLLLVGGEARHRAALEEKVRAAGLSHAVRFTGLLPMDRMPACLGLADALVSPRVKGTNTALKLYGYMQTGKAIVATDLETHTQVLDPGCAWLCPPEPQALGAALAAALGHPAEAARRGAAAARLVHERFGLDRFDRQVRELYEQLTGDKAG
jgi:glycosyltransferase involved in cell wall biosynthesis